MSTRSLSLRGRRPMWIAIALAVGMTGILQVVGQPLKTAAAPQGILSFEFAGSVPAAQAMIASWDARARSAAGLSLGLDFLYPPLYAAAISLSCLAAAAQFGGGARRFGSWLAAAVWLAAALDYVENVALIQLLFGATSGIWPPLAYGCAAVKFGIILFGLLFALAGGARRLLTRP